MTEGTERKANSETVKARPPERYDLYRPPVGSGKVPAQFSEWSEDAIAEAAKIPTLLANPGHPDDNALECLREREPSGELFYYPDTYLVLLEEVELGAAWAYDPKSERLRSWYSCGCGMEGFQHEFEALEREREEDHDDPESCEGGDCELIAQGFGSE